MINKENILLLITVIVSFVFIFIGYNIFKYDNVTNDFKTEQAKVLSIESIDEDETYNSKTITFNVEVLTGDYKNETVTVTQNVDNSQGGKVKEIEENDDILVTHMQGAEGSSGQWVFIEYNRINFIIAIVIVFLGLIVIIGRSKGIRTIISLIFTVAVIFLVYIPSILNGFNVYISTIIISIYIIFMSLIIINGYNKKTLCAILGNLGGVLIAGGLGIIISNAIHLTGIVDEEYIYMYFMFFDKGINISLTGIIWGSIVIGSLGAVMDVSMSIASSMNELSENMKDKTIYKLIKSGMNIGKDAIGTMTNTLILAYVGSSLATILLLTAYNNDIVYLFNKEMIIVEILQSILGSMGILFAVPFTVVISARIFNRDKE